MPSLRTILGILKRTAVALLFTGFGALNAGISTAADVAIKGYDPVVYFKAGKAQQGSEAFTFLWHGMTYHFISKDNRDIFAANPEKYAPQYDGYCAWAMTEARKAITDPEVWTIVDGKLYLNCSREAYAKWSKDIPGHIKKADKIWLQMQGGN